MRTSPSSGTSATPSTAPRASPSARLPYRDFPFAHAPLTFLIQAAIIRLTGRVFFHHVLYAAIIGGLGTVLTWRIASASLQERVAHAWTIALFLAAPLTVLGIYCILPFPPTTATAPSRSSSPSGSCSGLAQLQKSAPTKQKHRSAAFATGAALCLPSSSSRTSACRFCRQSALCSGCFSCLRRRASSSSRHQRRLQITALQAACLAILAGGRRNPRLRRAHCIHFTVGLGNYIHWTIQFAAQRRLPGLTRHARRLPRSHTCSGPCPASPPP